MPPVHYYLNTPQLKCWNSLYQSIGSRINWSFNERLLYIDFRITVTALFAVPINDVTIDQRLAPSMNDEQNSHNVKNIHCMYPVKSVYNPGVIWLRLMQ